MAAIAGGAIMGAATSAAFALGGAAFTTGIVIAGIKISGVTLFGIAVYGASLAGMVKYGLDSYAYDKETTFQGYFLSFATGGIEGMINFTMGGVAGYLGFFKYSGAEKIKKPLLAFLKKPGEMIIKSLFFSLPATLIRSLFKKRIKYLYD